MLKYYSKFAPNEPKELKCFVWMLIHKKHHLDIQSVVVQLLSLQNVIIESCNIPADSRGIQSLL
jgi:hypothetical protein